MSLSFPELREHPVVVQYLAERKRQGGATAGKLRMVYQSRERRQEIARAASMARWHRGLPGPDHQMPMIPLVTEQMRSSPFAWMLGIRGDRDTA